jgi:RNA polymerase sigma-70 factor, ECF subfamily
VNAIRPSSAALDVRPELPAISMSESALHFSVPAASHIAAGRTLSDKRMTPPPAANDSSSESDWAEDRPQGRESLEATLRRAAAGDQAAWRDVVETYSGRVFGLIRAQCNNTDLAEEITQSTFCTIVVKIGGYTELGKFEQWLFRIAMNRLRDEMRRRKRQARSMEDETLIGLAGEADDDSSETRGSSVLQDPAQVAALRAALAQLPDADQQIIHLRHHGELSFKQIAEILEQPLGTVLARQHRALKKLAELLKGRFGEAE